MAGLENAALNGDLSRPQRSPSPSRSISTISSEEEEEEDGAGLSSGDINPQRGEGYSTGSRTGPKGVLSDRKEHDAREKNEQRVHLERVKREQEKRAIIGSTVGEEEELREKEKLIRSAKEDEEEEDLDRIRRLRLDELKNNHHQLDMDLHGPVKRKGLREVGKEGFLNAVERPGWVVVLIYEPGIPRCTDLLASLLSLSLSLDYTIKEMTILRARATRLGFSLLPNATKDEQADEDDRDQEEVQADIDVLPTLLVYLDGELVKNWVRVDWEVKEDGVEGLLKREGILSEKKILGLKSEEYDDDEFYD